MKRIAPLLILPFGILVLSAAAPAAASPADAPKGHLFIIGGGNRSPEMMKRFVDLAAAGPGGRIVIFPMASAEPATVGPEQAEDLRKLGAKDVAVQIVTREQALAADSGKILEGVGGVFFSGGVQSRVTDILLDTPLQTKLLEIYAAGAVVGGTSAGAAIMSEIMITGDEKRKVEAGREFETIQAGNVVTTRGLGLISSAIVDQHFATRKRHNRLISLVLEHPDLVGIGIDESTAIVVSGGSSFEVVGEKNVIVYDARAAKVARRGADAIGGAGLRMHVLLPGDTFDLQAKPDNAR
jgi:cyanophycinase